MNVDRPITLKLSLSGNVRSNVDEANHCSTCQLLLQAAAPLCNANIIKELAVVSDRRAPRRGDPGSFVLDTCHSFIFIGRIDVALG
jgi:hypothetical protein